MKRKITAIMIAIAMMLTLIPTMPAYAASELTVGTGGAYSTLWAALSAAANGDTIKLLTDVTEIINDKFDTTGKNITINGQGHTITGSAGLGSTALKLSGSGTIMLKDITLQGGTASSGDSTGLTVFDSVNVLNCVTVNVIAGTSPNQSVGVWNNGTGTVNVTTATAGECTGTNIGNQSTGVVNYSTGTVNVTTANGGKSGYYSIGVNNASTGTINVTTAIGGEAKFSYGVGNYTGTVNVTTATAGTATLESYGVRSVGTGTINADTATAGTATTSYGAFNSGGTINVANAVYPTSGTVSTGAAFVAHLTLQKGTGAECVLDSITVASGSATTIGTLPNVSKNGIEGAWYTDSAASTPFAGTTVTGETTLYSTFYPDYTITSIANQSMTALTAGYGAGTQETKTLTVTRTGAGGLASLATALSGANAANFTITQPLITTLNSVTPSTTFTVKANDGLPAGTYTATVTISATNMDNQTFIVTQVVNTASSGGGSSSGGSGGGSSTPATGVTSTVTVNGKSENAGTVSNSKSGDKTVTKVTIDDKKIQEKINAETKNSTVSIPISGTAEIGEGVLNGQTIKDMEKKESILEIKTGLATYSLPASEINIDSVSSEFGKAVKLEDIKISVKIAETSADKTKIVQDEANKNNYQVVVKPVDFEITCTSGSKTITVSKFNGYVERVVAIPDGVDPSKVTTGVVLNKDGTFSHVPTTIVKIEGKYYAKINSLTNSTYSLIYNPIEFADVAKHWAKDSVNEMGSRLVISGVGENKFEPNRDITRAEFAAIMVRALGLAPDDTKNKFSDVEASKWYSGYVGTAASYGIISGYEGNNFAPNAKINREQAMTMVARAMAITELDSTTASANMQTPLSGYADTDKISNYAKTSIGSCIKTGVVTGKTSDTIAPKSNITRAEVAVIIERLLEKSELI